MSELTIFILGGVFTTCIFLLGMHAAFAIAETIIEEDDEE